jgi:hypothetical protein
MDGFGTCSSRCALRYLETPIGRMAIGRRASSFVRFLPLISIVKSTQLARSMNYFFWLLLNLGVPILGPLFILSLAAVSFGKDTARELIMTSVKDGQLYWSAIALSSAAIYELDVALLHRREVVDVSITVIPFVILIFSSVIVTCAVLVAIASIAARELARSMNVLSAHVPPDPTLKLSIGLTTFAVLAYAVTHAFYS